MTDSDRARVPNPPQGFSPEAFFEGQLWHQKWEVFRGVFTPGVNRVAKLFKNSELPDDMTGKRVLDIGAWNGCCSFECERRGATEVVAYSLENPDATGFSQLKGLLGSCVRYVQGSVYALTAAELGEYDIVLFFGVLYHLRYPLLAIDRIRAVSRGEVYVETHVVPRRLFLRHPFTPLQRVCASVFDLSKVFAGTPVWRQYKEFELHAEDRSNWFGPNVPAVVESFETAGFDTVHLRTVGGGTRAYFKGTVQESRPDRLTSGAYEGQSVHNADLAGLPTPSTSPIFSAPNRDRGEHSPHA